MPVRIREPEDLPACIAVLRRVHEISGYPSCWPDDPVGWITPRTLVTAWVAEHDSEIAGHVALVRGMRLESLLRATGLPPGQLGAIARLYVDPVVRRMGLARALLEAAADSAIAHGLRPVLDEPPGDRPSRPPSAATCGPSLVFQAAPAGRTRPAEAARLASRVGY